MSMPASAAPTASTGSAQLCDLAERTDRRSAVADGCGGAQRRHGSAHNERAWRRSAAANPVFNRSFATKYFECTKSIAQQGRAVSGCCRIVKHRPVGFSQSATKAESPARDARPLAKRLRPRWRFGLEPGDYGFGLVSPAGAAAAGLGASQRRSASSVPIRPRPCPSMTRR